MRLVSSDILPASLEVYAKKPEFLPEIANFLNSKPGVDEVNFQKIFIDRLINLTNIVKKSIFILTSLVFSTIISLIIGAFRMAIANNKKKVKT